MSVVIVSFSVLVKEARYRLQEIRRHCDKEAGNKRETEAEDAERRIV